jgi:hypothetical protein
MSHREPNPPRNSPSFDPERTNTTSTPNHQDDNKWPVPISTNTAMSDTISDSDTDQLFTPEPPEVEMSTVWPPSADANGSIADHVSDPDPPEADIDTVTPIEPLISAIFTASTIAIATIISSKFYIAPRPLAMDESSGMIACGILKELVREARKDKATAFDDCVKTQKKLEKARVSLADNTRAALRKRPQLLRTVDKLEHEFKEAKRALFEQRCRLRAWNERLDRINLLDE